MYKTVDSFMETVINNNPGQDEFHQAVEEVVESIWDYLQDNPHYLHTKILDRLVEPERVIMKADKTTRIAERTFRVFVPQDLRGAKKSECAFARLCACVYVNTSMCLCF